MRAEGEGSKTFKEFVASLGSGEALGYLDLQVMGLVRISTVRS